MSMIHPLDLPAIIMFLLFTPVGPCFVCKSRFQQGAL